MGPGEGVKSRLSQALTRGARSNSNSRLAVQISNPLPSRYAPWEQVDHDTNDSWRDMGIRKLISIYFLPCIAN